MKVFDFPLAKITIWFIVGILVSYYLKITIFTAAIAFSFGLLAFFVSYLLARKNKKTVSFFGISTYYLSFFIGILTLFFHTDSLQKTNYIHCTKAFENPQSITFTLRERLKGNSYNNRFSAIINEINSVPYSGKIIVNIAKDSLKKQLLIGNVINVKTILQHNAASKNPNQFNYSKYLEDRQIYAQLYSSKNALSINKKIKKDIWYYTDQLHRRIIKNLEKAHFNSAEMHVALALILGQQQEISADIIQDYQYSGATHILSVSGLHVGFIMLFINFILKPIPNTRRGSFIKLSSILISLAIFAVISGLSPSVLRSVVMFSFVATGNHLRRSGNIYHTLLVSILLILLFEPYFLFDVGFQLSYIALFFILWLQPLLKNIWSPKNKILINLWNALTVSFAAQIGAFPLCLYYFHQFPGLFFVTNIAIIPVLSFIMIAGIIVMIIAVFVSPPELLIYIFERSIYLLNLIIHYVASFESFVILDISFNFYYLISFYLFIVFFIIWLKKPNYSKLVLALSTVLLLQVSYIFTKKEVENQNETVIYNFKKQTLITERNGKTITAFTNDTVALKNNKNYILNSYIVGNFSTIKSIHLLSNLAFYNGKKIFIVDSSGFYLPKMKPDILLITKSPKINPDRIIKDMNPKMVIVDATNSYALQKYWKASCLKKISLFMPQPKRDFIL